MSEAAVQEPDTTGDPAPEPTPTVLAVVKRLPFTATCTLVMIVVGLATGTLWSALEDRTWYDQVGYGLPALLDGHVWTLATGPFFAVGPIFYIPMVLSFVLFTGWAEWKLGTARAAGVTIGGHLVGILGAALVLLATRPTGWPWAVTLGAQIDAGFSAGAFAALAVTAAVLRSPWRLRLRLGIGIYLIVALIYGGNLADLEHFVAGFAGLLAGHALTRGLGADRTGRPSRREWRLFAVAGVLVILLGTVLSWLIPSDGPLGPTGDTESDWVDVLITLVLALLLVNGLRKGKRTAWRWAVGIGILNVVVGLAVAVIVIVAVVLDEPWEIVGGPLFVADRLLWLLLLVVLIVGRHAFRTPSRRRIRKRQEFAADRGDAIAALHRHGGGTISWMATWPANRWFGTAPAPDTAPAAPLLSSPTENPGATADTSSDASESSNAPDGSDTGDPPGSAAGSEPGIVIAYQAHAGVAIGLGDPIGPAGSHIDAVDAFSRMADRAGLVPCMFSVGDATAAAAETIGWKHVQVAEDTLIDLPGLTFTGKPWQNVRSAINRAKKEGITFRMVTLADEPWSLVERIRGMSEEWVGDKSLPEMGFTLGGVDEALDRPVRVGIAQDAHGTLHGVTSWLPVYGPGGQVRGRTLDLMLRRPDGFRPVVEFLIAQSAATFRDEGVEIVSLSGAPLARAEGDGPVHGLARVLDQIGDVLEPLYGFRSLHAFKAKFQPRYEPMHLVYRDEADLARIGIAITRAYLPDTPVHELVKLTRT
ncbi:bifunctional lysylphosphatidylglycerol flippase/synthetase MprF [Pseudonocardia sp.]|uniref:bifunctional lysylphosphatidylglycerol flippase/synthetase MprF n=1 Tax=Pseudonocardia sp. TaxID=60912 RepID=UPI003D10D721